MAILRVRNAQASKRAVQTQICIVSPLSTPHAQQVPIAFRVFQLSRSSHQLSQTSTGQLQVPNARNERDAEHQHCKLNAAWQSSLTIVVIQSKDATALDPTQEELLTAVDVRHHQNAPPRSGACRASQPEKPEIGFSIPREAAQRSASIGCRCRCLGT